ncbi:Clavaminate synthase-like protein [Dichomitus squalens]|uniref:Clavaminate synthase-like protein n=1 Tax=Dichomitus squalens TaxID=114155 RepID=A0A4Q9PTI9_9APHY|nr:Clavaminate synthase-like protein [Dichomitus squalens]
MPGLTTYPPFPEDIPTCPLIVVDYQLVRAGNEEEINKLWKAATELGFCLRNHGVEEIDDMFEMGHETMALPLEEKLKFDEKGASFGYKVPGVMILDDNGTRDVTEYINVSKDDALAWPAVVHRTYPSTVNERMESTIKPFVKKSLEINHFLIDVLNDKLGLSKGSLAEFHKAQERSFCISRVIRAPPRLVPDEKVFLTAHTDYGSLSFLHNRLGGLQVLPPGSDKWLYVKPIPGHAICNVGDALNIFSGGIIRSNIHRVVPPPKDQGQYDRWSLIYFTRPNDTAPLKHLGEKSPMIAEAVARAPAGKYEPGMTMAEWMVRRIRAKRGANYNDPESRKLRRGTADTAIPEVVYA